MSFLGLGSSGSSSSSTSKVIYEKGDKQARADARELTKDYLEQFKNVPEAQQWLNNWYSMSLDQQEAEWKRLQSNSDSVASNLLSGGFDTNFAPVDNVTTPTGTDFNEVDGETSDFVKALSGGTAKAAEATAGGAGWNDAALTTSEDYTPIEAALTGDYKNADVSTIDSIDKGKATLATGLVNASGSGASAGSSGEFREFSPYVDAIASTSPEYQSAVAQLLGDYSPVNSQGYDASLSDLSRARQSLGAVDPTQSLQQLLTGQINQPYLSSMHDAYINDAMRGYSDAVQKLNQETMPNIGSEAFAAGQYGGSRQGIAQGLAMQQLERNARDLGIAAIDSGNELYGNAYQQAQDKMYGTANNLNSLAVQNEQFNTNAQNQAKQFTADAFNNMAQFNATNNQANQKYNADIANQMSQFNVNNLFNKGQFDTNALNQMSQFNAANTLQNNQAGASAFNDFNLNNAKLATDASIASANNATQASLANSNNALQQQLANANAQNTMTLANLQNQLEQYKFNASAENDMSKFNATNSLQSDQFNANSLNTIGQFNATNNLQNNQFNTSQANDLALANSQGAANVGIANANNATQAGVANANNATQTSQFNSELLTELSKFNAGNALNNNQFNAGQLNNLGLANSTNQLQSDQFDATNLMNNNQFNANLGLQNNTQQMTQTGQNLQNALTGLSTQTTGLGNLQQALGSIYSGQSALNNYEKAWDLDNLDIAKSAASMSPIGTITSTSGGGGNPLAQLGGAAMSGLGAYGLYQGLAG